MKCAECGEEIIKGYGKKKNFCSVSCLSRGSSKSWWANKENHKKRVDKMRSEEYKQKMSKASKENWKNPEYRENVSNGLKEKWKDPAYRNLRTQQSKEIWGTPGYREHMIKVFKEVWERNGYHDDMVEKTKEQWKDPKYRKLMHDMLTSRWKDPAYHTKMVEIHKERCKADEFRKKMSDSQKKNWEDPIYRNRMEQMLSDLWKDPEYADRVSKAAFKFKDYIMPSGKLERVQGYEPQAIDKLLERLDESDIIVSLKDINKLIGRIPYEYNDTISTYYPDIYVKSEHKIYEVKSEFTFNRHKGRNLAKQKAVLELGIGFEFMIL